MKKSCGCKGPGKKVKSNPSRQELEKKKYKGKDLKHWDDKMSQGSVSKADGNRLKMKYKDRELKKATTRSTRANARAVGATGDKSKTLKAAAKHKKALGSYSKAFHSYKRDSARTSNSYKMKGVSGKAYGAAKKEF